jgi:heme/copper-type cytochrome/quinol oxidase subunit 2
MSKFNVLAEAAAGTGAAFPTWILGAIAMAVFILLGVVTWSYRDVANRHDHKTNNSASHH